MRVAVLGTGTVGRAWATRLAELGHGVVVGTRDPAVSRERDQGWTGPPLNTFAEAVAGADLVVNALSGAASADVLTALAPAIGGAVVMDISNPLDFSAGFPPTLFVKDTDSLGEQIQRAFPQARVVKTLNTLNADLMVDPASLGAESSVFVSGDDAAAKATVTGLLISFGHTDVIDLGGIDTARGTEMLLPVWLRLMGALGTATFNFKIVR